MEKCTGDNYNVRCPHCERCNHYVCQGIKMELGVIKSFQKECVYCHKTVYYYAKYEISIDAYPEDLIEHLRKQ